MRASNGSEMGSKGAFWAEMQKIEKSWPNPQVTTRMRQTFGLPPDLVFYLENCALGRGCRLIDEKVGNVCNLKKKD